MKLSLLCLCAAALSVSAFVPVKREEGDLLKITPLEGNCHFETIAKQVTCIPVPGAGDPYCYKFKETPGSDYCMWVDNRNLDGTGTKVNGPYIL